MKNRPILSLPKRLPLSPAEARNDDLSLALDEERQPRPQGRHRQTPESIDFEHEDHRPGRDLASTQGATP